MGPHIHGAGLHRIRNGAFSRRSDAGKLNGTQKRGQLRPVSADPEATMFDLGREQDLRRVIPGGSGFNQGVRGVVPD